MFWPRAPLEFAAPFARLLSRTTQREGAEDAKPLGCACFGSWQGGSDHRWIRAEPSQQSKTHPSALRPLRSRLARRSAERGGGRCGYVRAAANLRVADPSGRMPLEFAPPFARLLSRTRQREGAEGAKPVGWACPSSWQWRSDHRWTSGGRPNNPGPTLVPRDLCVLGLPAVARSAEVGVVGT